MELIARKRQRFYEKSSGQNNIEPTQAKGFVALICFLICFAPFLFGFIIHVAVLLNFVFIPALSYGSQLALGALGVSFIYSIIRPCIYPSINSFIHPFKQLLTKTIILF